MTTLRSRLRAGETANSAEESELVKELKAESEKERLVLESQNDTLTQEISQLKNYVNELQVSWKLLFVTLLSVQKGRRCSKEGL